MSNSEQNVGARGLEDAASAAPVFGTVEQALADIAAGKFIVVADDEDRENEGDLVCAAELVTPEMVNFMLEAKGMICLAMTNDWANQLGLKDAVHLLEANLAEEVATDEKLTALAGSQANVKAMGTASAK